MKEIWKDIKGYEGYYQISNYGRIKSLKRMAKSNNNNFRPIKEKILKQCKAKGYYSIMLCKDGTEKTFQVHRLVALAFIPNLENKPQINHKDENPLNNNVNNLEWCTAKYNCNYGTRTERSSKALKNKIFQYDLHGNFIKEWESAMDVYKILGYDFSMIRKCCRGEKQRAYGYIWKNAD